MRLNSVLLPTFGRPTTATMGSGVTGGLWADRAGTRPNRAGAADCAGGRPATISGSEVVRPAGVAAAARAAVASSSARAAASGVPASRRIRSRDAAQILDRSGRSAGDADHRGAAEDGRRRSGPPPTRSGSPACRRSRTAGSAPWCSRSIARRRRPSGRPRARPRSCPPGGGS